MRDNHRPQRSKRPTDWRSPKNRDSHTDVTHLIVGVPSATAGAVLGSVRPTGSDRVRRPAHLARHQLGCGQTTTREVVLDAWGEAMRDVMVEFLRGDPSHCN